RPADDAGGGLSQAASAVLAGRGGSSGNASRHRRQAQRRVPRQPCPAGDACATGDAGRRDQDRHAGRVRQAARKRARAVDRRRKGGEHQGGMKCGVPRPILSPASAAKNFIAMFRRDTPAEAAFRMEVRTWLEANLPVALRGRITRPPPAELMPWYHTLSRKGWIAPHWPKQHGGMGATLNEQLIMTEELARIGAPHLPAQGLNHIGPILMEFGTAEQKARHLPPIIAGSVIWAQGYSEPGAGSDLASLSTRATLQGARFVLQGQKGWTTWGHHSDWMFALVRTDPQAQPRQAGISFLLIDLRSPGIRIRPIKTIAGDDEFSEVFLDGVIVPTENLVGKLNDGWRIANALLERER